MIHVLISAALIVLVMVQHGRGADAGAAFGAGGSDTMFGSQGSGSFLTKVTATLVALFFCTSLSLSYLMTHQVQSKQILHGVVHQKSR
jgi:preprotein translocase subunit SecG